MAGSSLLNLARIFPFNLISRHLPLPLLLQWPVLFSKHTRPHAAAGHLLILCFCLLSAWNLSSFPFQANSFLFILQISLQVPLSAGSPSWKSYTSEPHEIFPSQHFLTSLQSHLYSSKYVFNACSMMRDWVAGPCLSPLLLPGRSHSSQGFKYHQFLNEYIHSRFLSKLDSHV